MKFFVLVALIGFLFGIVLITFYLGNKIFLNYSKSSYVTIPYSCFDAFTSRALALANFYRKRHKVKELKMANLTIFDIAYGYACDVIIGHAIQTEDQIYRDFLGENINLMVNSYVFSFTESNCEIYAQKTIEKWYNESFYYDYKNGRSFLNEQKVNNFTQLVWKDSSEIGFGMSASTTKDANGNYWLFLVAYFSPRGNLKGQYQNNVFSPT